MCFCALMGGAILLPALTQFPIFKQAREAAYIDRCMDNLKKLSQAMLLYAHDHGGSLPPASQWSDAVRPYVSSERVYRCPSVERQGYGYAMNSNLSMHALGQLADPAGTPLLYDSSNLSWNASDPFTTLPTPPRHLGGNNIAFADGRVELRH